jgi:hypothetical protein
VRLLSLAEARYNEGGGKAEIDAEAYAAQVLQLWAVYLDGADLRLFFVLTCVTPSSSPFVSVSPHFYCFLLCLPPFCFNAYLLRRWRPRS